MRVRVLFLTDFAWDTEPIDGVAAYKAGHGKKHGRYLFGDGMISTPAVLSEARLSKAASESPDGQPRQKRRPNAEDVQSFEQQLQEEMERHLHQQREEREQKLKQEREEMDRKLHQEREEMGWKRQQAREAWEAEMQPERDYYKKSLLVSIDIFTFLS
jgi:hypothetical protein